MCRVAQQRPAHAVRRTLIALSKAEAAQCWRAMSAALFSELGIVLQIQCSNEPFKFVYCLTCVVTQSY